MKSLTTPGGFFWRQLRHRVGDRWDNSFWRLTARSGLPLPAKLFMSYLLVVLVGALPTYFYIKQLFLAEFLHDAVRRVAGHAQLLANFVSNEDDSRRRIAELRHLVPTLTERITYIGSNGRTLFDSSIAEVYNVENQLTQPEIARALGTLEPDDIFDFKLPHVGVSRRYSETGKVETLYVAVRLLNDAGVGSDCLRLAIPIAEIESLSVVLVRIFRNSQAAAVSSALLLSLLAAVAFMRPLQRLSHTAKALAAGDYTVEVASNSRDEIGEVGRSLNLLGQQLRKRLAVAEAGEAMLVQLVQGITLPVAIFSSDNRLVVLNGAAQAAFGKTPVDAESNFLGLVRSASFAAAKEAAAAQAEPEHLHYTQAQTRWVGWVHVLNHPSGAPFYAYLGEEVVHRPHTLLPKPHELQAVAVGELVQQALLLAETMLRARGLNVELVGKLKHAEKQLSHVMVCDSHKRVQLSLVLALTHAMCTPKSTQLALWCLEKPNRLGLVLGATLADSAVQPIQTLLQPLGGMLKNSPEQCVLFLSRA